MATSKTKRAKKKNPTEAEVKAGPCPCGEMDEDSYMLHCTSELCDKWWHSGCSHILIDY